MLTDDPIALVLKDVEVLESGRVDVRLRDGVVTDVGVVDRHPGEACLVGHGRALLAGLHDHHCHVLAAAAAAGSVPCGPPQVADAAGLARRLRAGKPINGWLRGVGYDESVAGPLDAAALDRLSPDLPTRVQHRGGALWMLNSEAVRRVRLAESNIEGVERDASGHPTGRLWRLDGWLRERLGPQPPPDIAVVSRTLAQRGVTGVTDATADLPPDGVDAIVAGGLLQRLTSLGLPHGRPQVALGPLKIVISDHDLPSFATLSGQLAAARPRPVALHCVTREALTLALAVLEATGPHRRDRIEHAAVCPPALADFIARLGLTVVTQPSMIARRGDSYLDGVEADELPHLWPFASLLKAGVAVGCSSDAPYGDLDPWSAIAAAVERRAPSGREVAPGERVSTFAALCGYLSSADAPGGPPRTPAVGSPADLCLLDRPLADALAQPAEVRVQLTLVGGKLVHHADTGLDL